MNKITVKLNKLRIATHVVAASALMLVGYVAITAGISFTNRTLDTFAVQRVQAKGLVPATIKTVPVLSTADVKAQMNQALAENLGK